MIKKKNKFLLLVFAASFMTVFSCSSLSMKNGVESGAIVSTAKQYLGVPYKFGGSSPDGFDCSGFVQYVYKKNGILVPRTAHDQFNEGKKIRFSDAQPGDLIFFNTENSPTSHVVIYMGGMKFIHAPRTGKNVSIGSLSVKYWKKRYSGTVTYRNVKRPPGTGDSIPDIKKKDDKDFDFVVFDYNKFRVFLYIPPQA